MNWYYVEAGQQAGPVEEPQLEELYRNGRIQPDTLVWREGMANWLPYREAKPASTSSPSVATATAASTTSATAGEVVCAECNRIFSRDNAIQYGNVWVCANCKPLFIQKLKEGAALPGVGAFVYAGFWVRFGAKFIDNLITSIVGFPLGLLLGVAIPADSTSALVTRQAFAMLSGVVINLAYAGWFVGRFGATPGKMALKLKIVMADGSQVTYGRAVGRYLAELLSGCPTLMIGYIMAGFDEEKRALHDRICNTRVIRQ
jgi:uncharacterized RDD family membrane protein YckC